jgi:signal peptidase
MKALGSILSVVLGVALFSLCASVFAIRLLGMSAFVVTGASMEPTIHKGSLVLVQPVEPTAVARGDIITFDHYNQMTTHRVVAIDATDPASPIITTKGDANEVADPEPIQFPGKVGLYRTSIPFVGYVVAYAQAYWRLVLTILAACIFLGCAAMVLLRKDPPPSASGVGGEKEVGGRPAGPAPVTNMSVADEDWAAHIGWLRDKTTARMFST